MTSVPSPLLVTRDEDLLADVARLAAAAGVPLDVAHDAGSALAAWTRAPLVLVGTDLVHEAARASPVRRDAVHVVGHGPCSEAVFRSALGISATDVAELPAAEPWLMDRLTDVGDGPIRRARTVGVMGGAGGAGATVTAVALAAVAAEDGEECTLLDLDALGPGVERLVPLADEASDRRGAAEPVGWEVLLASTGRFGSRELRQALPGADRLAVVGWGAGPRVGLDAAVVREVTAAVGRASDVVVLDLPRQVDGVVRELLPRLDALLVVTPTTLAGTASTGHVLATVEPLATRVGLVARPCRGGLDPLEVAEHLGVDLCGRAPDERRLEELLALGLGPVPRRRGGLARAMRRLLGELSRAGGA